MKEREVLKYLDAAGKCPYDEWYASLRDMRSKARISMRITHASLGNLGHCEPVGKGVSEMKLDFGPGYRIYFGIDGNRIILLSGGDKSSQRRDVLKARELWGNYNTAK